MCIYMCMDSFASDEGKKVFWHSSAHVLGQALEEKYQDKVRLCDGPALAEGGFFYEMFLQDQLTVSESDFPALSGLIKRIVKQKQPFERMQVTRDFAQTLFGYSDYKRQMLQRIPSDEAVSLYRCGPLIDLCRGPHVPHTGTLPDLLLCCCLSGLAAKKPLDNGAVGRCLCGPSMTASHPSDDGSIIVACPL